MNERRRIDTNDDLHAQTAQVFEAFLEAEADVYDSGILVRVERTEGPARIRPLTSFGIRHEMSKFCRFVKTWFTQSGAHEKNVHPPMAVANDALASGEASRLRRLAGIVNHPTLAPDGAVLSGCGYDAQTGLYVDAEGLEINVPESPTDAEIEAARNLIFEMFLDFPFDCRASVAAVFALLVTILIRPLIDGPVPAFPVDAAAPGTGKTLAVQAIAVAITGTLPPLLMEIKDPAELQKTLFSASLERPEFLIFDNISSAMDSGNLAAIVTAGVIRGRILGRSEVVDIPIRAPIVPTGNNLSLSNELARRSVPCRLEANTAQPWTREGFRHPALLEWVKENRAAIISAGLTLGRAWIVRGRPKPRAKPLGSFEAWHHVIGGVLEVAGVPGLLENASQFYESADVETLAWTAFCTEWAKSFPVGGVPSRDLVELALRCEVIDEGRTERATQTALGRAMAKRVGRVFGSYKIKKLSVVSGLQFWKCEAV